MQNCEQIKVIVQLLKKISNILCVNNVQVSCSNYGICYDHDGVWGGSKVDSVYISVIRPSMVHASPRLSIKIHTLPACYQLVQPVSPTSISQTVPCLILSAWKCM